MLIGLLLAISCGVAFGIFLAPLRFLREWEWENIWSLLSIAAFLLGPTLVAFFTVPHLPDVIWSTGLPALALTLAIGAAAGVSGFLYSRTIKILGMGLATTLMAGSSMSMLLLPLVVLYHQTILRPSGLLTLAGVIVTVTGMALCSWGGSLREAQLAKSAPEPVAKRPGLSVFIASVMCCVVAGSISSAMNMALAFPNPILEMARKFGSSEFGAAIAYIAPFQAGTFVSNFLFAAHKVHRNKTFSRFWSSGAFRCLLWTLLMSAGYVFANVSYAGSLGLLGRFGAVIAWGVSMAAMILTSSLWDMFQGEWNGTPARVMTAGVIVLIIAIGGLSFAQYFHQIDISKTTIAFALLR